ncbi:MAG: type II secretion system protein GspD, partial [Terriglobales bacterium]
MSCGSSGWRWCSGVAALAACLSLSATAAGLNHRSAERLARQAVAEAQRGHWDAGFRLASAAAAAEPDNAVWVTTRELLRQRAALAHLERAHSLEAGGQRSAAAVEYRTALAIAPNNLDARQGLTATLGERAAAQPTESQMRVQSAGAPILIAPAAGERSFHLHSGLRDAIAQVAASYGLRAYVADQVQDQNVRLDLDHASFAQAMLALHDVARVDWIPLGPRTLYFDSSSQLPRVEPQAVRTFYVAWADSGIELSQVATVIRNLLGVRAISIDDATKALTLRASASQLDATESLLLEMGRPRGEVVLEIRLLELNASAARSLGLSLPDHFTLFALGPLLAQLQQNSSLQQQILQLFQQGGLNAILNSGAIPPGLLGQAQSLSPLLQNPFVVFGGGATLMALSVPGLQASFSASQSQVSTLETALLRARNGQVAELKIGQRYPVVSAAFSPISLSPAISKVIGNGSFLQPFPSFTYEDLGLDAKVTPELRSDGRLELQFDLTVSALSGASANDIPILSNRHVITAMGLANGQTVMVAGLFNQQETQSLAGLPGLGQIPALGRLFATPTRQRDRDQLAILVTPHVVQLPAEQAAGLWLPPSFAPASENAAPFN